MGDDANRDHVTTAEQENIISETMTNSQSLAFGMKVKTRMLSITFQ